MEATLPRSATPAVSTFGTHTTGTLKAETYVTFGNADFSDTVHEVQTTVGKVSIPPRTNYQVSFHTDAGMENYQAPTLRKV